MRTVISTILVAAVTQAAVAQDGRNGLVDLVQFGDGHAIVADGIYNRNSSIGKECYSQYADDPSSPENPLFVPSEKVLSAKFLHPCVW